VPVLDVVRRIWAGFGALGARRLIALGLTGLTVFVLVGVSGYMLNRPLQEALYTGLDPQDVTRIGAILNDAGIGFDISVSGDSVLVEYGEAARSRMLLAQNGLPRGDSAGYELFDKLGSLGLTSFMQQVTRVRALEGELARTIQLIDGIRAARVHLALKSEGSFRGNADQATASVVIRADQQAGLHAAEAVRHLVAAAIPGLAPSQVTVMNADGTILTSTDDSVSAAPEKLIGLERSLASDIEARVVRTMSPFLGIGNFRISVSAKLNADRRQISETAFDPNSRVERSVRTIKESGEASNAAGAAGVTVEQNVPVEETPSAKGDNSSEKKDRKEELTNYEINSKSVSTTSDGYGIDRLSIAVVVNKSVIVKMLGDNPSEEAVAAKVLELQQLASSAAGLVDQRGDKIAVTAANFVDETASVAEAPATGFGDLIGGNLGNIINASALILVTVLVLMLGLRPALRAIMAEALPSANDGSPALADMSAIGNSADGSQGIISQYATMGDGADISGISGGSSDPVFDNLAREVSNSPRDRLSKIVELDPDRAVDVLRQWLSEPAGQAS
jgi:flagellar M-ring protein FliF